MLTQTQVIASQHNGLIYQVNEFLKTSTTISAISIDGEWYGVGEVKYLQEIFENVSFITKQATLKMEDGTTINIILWNNKFPLPTFEHIARSNKHVVLFFGDIQDITILDILLELDFKFTSKVIPVYLFYSPLDLRVVLTDEQLRHHLKSGASISNGRGKKKKSEYGITKTRNITGKVSTAPLLTDDEVLEGIKHEGFVNLELKDLYGAANSNLEKFYDLVNYPNHAKKLIDPKNKDKMNIEAEKNPENFYTYAMSDSENLFILWDLRVKQINKIIAESLGFDAGYTTENCPRSSGSLVSDTFMKWMAVKYPLLVAGVEALAVPMESKKEIFKTFLSQLGEQKQNIENGFFQIGKKEIPIENLHKQWNQYKKGDGIAGMARASIGAFAGLSNNESVFNALVFGGRCSNENPCDYLIKDVYDGDLQSCYGTSLRTLNYPIGRPTIKTGNNGHLMTLGQFRKNEHKKLESGMWQIVINGKLNFSQDLIYSKLGLSVAKVRSFVSVFDDDDDHSDFGIEKAHISAEFKLLRNEIVNGIITEHSLKVLYSVASSQEISALDKLNVTSLAGYYKKDKVSCDEFYEIVKNPKTLGSLNVAKNDNTYTLDERTTKWCSLPLEGFVGKFVEYRNKMKKLAKQNKGSEQGKYFDALQNSVKLFINVVYGVFASPFFPCSNAILANSITDRARMGAWMMSKPNGTVQSITDGGLAGNNSARFLKPENKNGEKPTLNCLSNYNSLNNHRCIELGNFVDDFDNILDEFKKAKKKDIEENNIERENYKKCYGKWQDILDERANTHVNNFWQHYGLNMPFKIELKIDNLAEMAVYTNASDYLLIEPVNPECYGKIEDRELIEVSDKPFEGSNVSYTVRVRGANEDFHPKKLWLLYLANLIKKPNHSAYKRHLIGVKEWQSEAESSKDERWSDFTLPGMSKQSKAFLRPELQYSTTDTEMEHERGKKSRQKRSIKFDKLKFSLDNPAYPTLSLFDENIDREKLLNYLNNKQHWERDLKKHK